MPKSVILTAIQGSIAFWRGVLEAPTEYRDKNPNRWHVVARRKLKALKEQEQRLLTEL